MDEETYDTFKPTSVKPTVREYKVRQPMTSQTTRILTIFSAFINWENSIPNFKRKLKPIGNKKKKMTLKQRNGMSVIHIFNTHNFTCFKD